MTGVAARYCRNQNMPSILALDLSCCHNPSDRHFRILLFAMAAHAPCARREALALESYLRLRFRAMSFARFCSAHLYSPAASHSPYDCLDPEAHFTTCIWRFGCGAPFCLVGHFTGRAQPGRMVHAVGIGNANNSHGFLVVPMCRFRFLR